MKKARMRARNAKPTKKIEGTKDPAPDEDEIPLGIDKSLVNLFPADGGDEEETEEEFHPTRGCENEEEAEVEVRNFTG